MQGYCKPAPGDRMRIVAEVIAACRALGTKLGRRALDPGRSLSELGYETRFGSGVH